MATIKQTFVYKTDPVPIQLDVYLPSAPPAEGQGLPLLVWFHGGGLLQGNRDGVAPHHLNGVTKHGYALISADYRLSPQVSVGEVLDGKQPSHAHLNLRGPWREASPVPKLHLEVVRLRLQVSGIILGRARTVVRSSPVICARQLPVLRQLIPSAADVKDCLAWTAAELPRELAAAGNNNGTLLDTTRMAVSGSSAGGYLALLAGLYATGPVKPKVILPIYPITDPLGTFFTTPQKHPAGHIERAALEPYLDPKAPVQTRTAWEDDPRAKFYFYMMQEAILA